MTRRFNLVLAVACYLLACRLTPALGDLDAPAVPACPPPQLRQAGWHVLGNAKIGISFKAPKKYHQKHWDVTVGNFIGATFRGDDFQDLSFSVEAVEGRSLEQRKIIRQPDYQDYTECAESIRGHQAIIQSFRGGGAIIVGGRSSIPYAIAGVCELRPGRILTFHGSTPSRQAQEEQLAIIRTLEFIR